MALVDVAQRLLDSIKTIRFCSLKIPSTINMKTTNVDVRHTINNPIRDRPPDSRTGQNADAIQARRHEVPLYLGRFSNKWR